MRHNITKIILASLFLGAAAANAQDKQTLDILVSKGVITQAEADGIAKDAVKISAKEKTTKSVKISGRLQVQYENINVEENGESLVAKNNFLMRRMFLGADADLGAGWSATIVADFANTKTYIEHAFISKKVGLDYLTGTLDIGYKKANFGYEENTSSSKLLSIERSLATRYWSEGNNGRRLGFGARHVGVYWNGKIQQVEGLEYGLGVTNSYNDSPTAMPAGADNTLMYWANAAYTANFENVSLKFGVNFGYTNGTNVAGDAGTVHAAMYGLNPYIAASLYGLDIWGDFLFSDVENGKNSYTESARPMGFNVGAEYKFDIGEWGKIAPTLRYSWIDTDGRGIKMSDGVRDANASNTYNAGQSVYVGVNWYIVGNSVKFQLGYEWAQLNGAQDGKVAKGHADANAVRAQMQLLF